MDRLYELIMKIKPRPELYIGTRDVQRLRAFLSGYCQACEEMMSDCSGSWLWDGFRLYLAQKYSDCRSLDWAGLLEHHEPDGQSTDAFFRLLEEYFCSDAYPHTPLSAEQEHIIMSKIARRKQ